MRLVQSAICNLQSAIALALELVTLDCRAVGRTHCRLDDRLLICGESACHQKAEQIPIWKGRSEKVAAEVESLTEQQPDDGAFGPGGLTFDDHAILLRIWCC
jgi:hypothetical protein